VGDRYNCTIMNACKALASQGRVNPTAYDKTMEGIEDLFAKLRQTSGGSAALSMPLSN